MLRSIGRTAWLVIGLVCVSGLAEASLAQDAARHRPRPQPQPQLTPQPTPPPKPYRGPGYLARPSFAGIGRVKADVDLLSSPARNKVFPSPPVIVNPLPRPQDPQWDNRGRWYYRRDHDRRYPYPYVGDQYFGRPITYYPYSDVVTSGVGLTVGNGYSSYGYAYPTSTVGVMELPAPAIRYDPTTGTYVYAYGNPAGPPLVTPMAPQPPAANGVPEAAAPEPAPTAMDAALHNLQMDKPGAAVTGLREHLKEDGEDARAQRVLGVALLRQKRFDDGVASMRQAYRQDPKLADEVMNAAALGLNPAELRSLVLRTVTYAHRVDTGSAWLTVAVLMQTEGRLDPAGQMLERAKAKGLETEVLTAMKAALEPGKD